LRVYADSSFIVSTYTGDSLTSVALREVRNLQTGGHSIFLTDLALLETANAFQLCVFRGYFSASKASELIGFFESDIDVGLFRVVPPQPLMWKIAGQLSDTHAARLGCRSLDILHAANALLLKADLFLTFDQRQRTLAIAAGLNAPDLLA